MDAALVRALRRFGVSGDTSLGEGGESVVYALGADRVLRIRRKRGRADELYRRQHLLDRLRRDVPFAIPEVLEVGEVDGFGYAVERRLPGHSLMAELATADGARRSRLIDDHLNAAAIIGDLLVGASERFYGELVRDDAIRTESWSGYLRARAAASLRASIPELQRLDATAICDALPETAERRLVHLDAFAGNMLTDGSRITAVLDFGTTAILGDRRLDPIAAAAYLLAADITPTGRREDRPLVLDWLREHELDTLLLPMRRWLAAFWSTGVDDAALLRWCRSVLVGGAPA